VAGKSRRPRTATPSALGEALLVAPSSTTDEPAAALAATPLLDRPSRGVFVLLGSLGVAAIVLFFFTPRFVLFGGLDLRDAWSNPEVNRAIDTFKQIEDPFKPTTNATNRVITWRVLFPLVAHYLHFPRLLYLALPPLGCLLVLALALDVLLRRTGDRLLALAGGTLAGSTSWFFVSTGWLTYFDSWYVLGLCVVTFVRSRIALVLVCAATPWIDERFILALPLCLLVRGMLFDQLVPRPSKRWLIDVALVLGVTGIYVAIRLAALATGNDPTSGAHLEEAVDHPRSLLRMLEGLWHGLRLLWIGVVLFVWLECSRRHPLATAVLIVTLLVTVLVNLLIANDLSRSTSALVPAGLAGVMLAARQYSVPRFAHAIVALAIVDLLLPARHVITVFTVPIRYLYTEIDNYLSPPMVLRSDFYIQRGGMFAQQNQLERAIHDYTTALQLDPRQATAYNNRGVVHARRGEWPEAEADYRAAMDIDPHMGDAYLNRAQLRIERRDTTGAIEDLDKALEVTPPQWPSRQAAAQLRAKLSSP
jgi:tetratricopeptide (TPR) repeat protein